MPNNVMGPVGIQPVLSYPQFADEVAFENSAGRPSAPGDRFYQEVGGDPRVWVRSSTGWHLESGHPYFSMGIPLIFGSPPPDEQSLPSGGSTTLNYNQTFRNFGGGTTNFAAGEYTVPLDGVMQFHFSGRMDAGTIVDTYNNQLIFYKNGNLVGFAPDVNQSGNYSFDLRGDTGGNIANNYHMEQQIEVAAGDIIHVSWIYGGPVADGNNRIFYKNLEGHYIAATL